MAVPSDPSRIHGARVLGADKVISPRGWLLPRRVLEEDVLLYTRRGVGEITLGEATHPLRRDHLYLLRRGVPHLIRAGSRSAIECWSLRFLLLDGEGGTLDANVLGIPEVTAVAGRRALERLFVECVDHALHRERTAHLTLLASLFALLDALVQDARGDLAGEGSTPARRNGAARARQTEQVMAAVALMMRHVTGDLSLEELAAHAEMSPSHFEKVFKRVMGSSPHAYYIGLKMERAKEQMAAGGRTLSEIARNLGFTSLHHFSRTFRRYEGELPSRYAERARHGAE